MTTPDKNHETTHNYEIQLQSKWKSANTRRNVFKLKDETWLNLTLRISMLLIKTKMEAQVKILRMQQQEKTIRN